MLINRESITLLMLNNRIRETNNPIGWLPPEIASYIINIGYDQDPHSDINVALKYAASGQEKDLVTLTKMITKNPRLLLQAGNVMTRGGFFARRKTLYEFFLGEGDPIGAKRIEFGFQKILNGEIERQRQYGKYKPHFEALARQIKLKKTAYDLKPLLAIILKTEDIEIALAHQESDLNKKMHQFKNAIQLKNKIDGLHYKHYTTLMYLLQLRPFWQELYNKFNSDNLVFAWGKIVGGLQLNLPATDRFAFARKFEDDRTVNYIDCEGSFPDASSNKIGGIYGTALEAIPASLVRYVSIGFNKLMDAKISDLRSLCTPRLETSLTHCRHLQPHFRPQVI